MTTILADKMIKLAEEGHPRSQELREKASAFEEAAKGFYASPQTATVEHFMDCWARARTLYAACSNKHIMED